jgi:flagellar biosynthetic protein FliR
MGGGTLTGWVFSSLLLSLRIAPAFALAPPFSLTRMPMLFRLLFGVGMAACMVAGNPAAAAIHDISAGPLLAAGARELMLGAVAATALQLMFAALYVAGRTIDIQAGFGLALLIDPASQVQTPLVGTFFAYAAGAVFFALNGHHDLLRIFAASLQAIPLGQGTLPASLAPLTGFVSVIFLTGMGVAGGCILSLFLADLAIAALSRTVPQMNVLVLGFQVKTLILLLVLPLALGGSAAALARMTTLTLEAIPGLM